MRAVTGVSSPSQQIRVVVEVVSCRDNVVVEMDRKKDEKSQVERRRFTTARRELIDANIYPP